MLLNGLKCSILGSPSTSSCYCYWFCQKPTALSPGVQHCFYLTRNTPLKVNFLITPLHTQTHSPCLLCSVQDSHNRQTGYFLGILEQAGYWSGRCPRNSSQDQPATSPSSPSNTRHRSIRSPSQLLHTPDLQRKLEGQCRHSHFHCHLHITSGHSLLVAWRLIAAFSLFH